MIIFGFLPKSGNVLYQARYYTPPIQTKMPVYAYCESEMNNCQSGADTPMVVVVVDDPIVRFEFGIGEYEFNANDYTFEDETVRTESSVARIEVRSNMPPPNRYFCPYCIERRLGRYF